MYRRGGGEGEERAEGRGVEGEQKEKAGEGGEEKQGREGGLGKMKCSSKLPLPSNLFNIQFVKAAG